MSWPRRGWLSMERKHPISVTRPWALRHPWECRLLPSMRDLGFTRHSGWRPWRCKTGYGSEAIKSQHWAQLAHWHLRCYWDGGQNFRAGMGRKHIVLMQLCFNYENAGVPWKWPLNSAAAAAGWSLLQSKILTGRIITKQAQRSV